MTTAARIEAAIRFIVQERGVDGLAFLLEAECARIEARDAAAAITVKRCARPGCTNSFTKSPLISAAQWLRQLYCSRECGREVTKGNLEAGIRPPRVPEENRPCARKGCTKTLKKRPGTSWGAWERQRYCSSSCASQDTAGVRKAAREEKAQLTAAELERPLPEPGTVPRAVLEDRVLGMLARGLGREAVAEKTGLSLLQLAGVIAGAEARRAAEEAEIRRRLRCAEEPEPEEAARPAAPERGTEAPVCPEQGREGGNSEGSLRSSPEPAPEYAPDHAAASPIMQVKRDVDPAPESEASAAPPKPTAPPAPAPRPTPPKPRPPAPARVEPERELVAKKPPAEESVIRRVVPSARRAVDHTTPIMQQRVLGLIERGGDDRAVARATGLTLEQVAEVKAGLGKWLRRSLRPKEAPPVEQDPQEPLGERLARIRNLTAARPDPEMRRLAGGIPLSGSRGAT